MCQFFQKGEKGKRGEDETGKAESKTILNIVSTLKPSVMVSPFDFTAARLRSGRTGWTSLRLCTNLE